MRTPHRLRFCDSPRALFGLIQSLFLLGGTLKQHLDSLKYPEEVEEIMKSLYVDDVISGTGTVDQGCSLKEVAVSVFGEAGFEFIYCINGTPMSRNWRLKLYREIKGKRTPRNS